MSEIRVFCPHCGKEIIVEIDENSIIPIKNDRKIVSQLENKNIEFGCVKEMK